MYDFDETERLTLDETVLALRATTCGLAKLTKVVPPTDDELEQIAMQSFRHQESTGTDEDPSYASVERRHFLQYCLSTPEIMSWVEYFDDLVESEDSDLAAPHPLELQHQTEHVPGPWRRQTHHLAVMDPNSGTGVQLTLEEAGLAVDRENKQPWQQVVPFLTNRQQLGADVDHHQQPPELARMEWVYGYNGHLAKHNVHYTKFGEVVYPAATMVVVFNIGDCHQTHYTGHVDLVSAVKVFHGQSGPSVAASGEIGVRPAVHVWDTRTLTTLSVLRGFHRYGITQLDFSPSGEHLVTLGMDPYHCIAVYHWRSQTRILAAKATWKPCIDVRYLDENTVACCGGKHLYFWKKTETCPVFKKYRGLDARAQAHDTYCVAKLGERVVTGSSAGYIHVWEGRNLVRSIKGHAGLVHVLETVSTTAGKVLLSGCTSGKIQIWNERLEIGGTFNLASLGPIDSAICSLSFDVNMSKILCATRSCEMFELEAEEGRNVHPGPILRVHSCQEVWGLATHPHLNNIVCSVGYDRTVRVWNTATHKIVRMATLDSKARCCTFSPDGQLIVVGLGNGAEEKSAQEKREGGFVVLSEETLTIVFEGRDSKQLITDVKFSPDGETLAMSSYDGSIYIYNGNGFAARTRCQGHQGKVTNIDFSRDGQYLMSNCTSGELLFWSTQSGEQQVAKDMRDTEWVYASCPLSYGTSGFLPLFLDETRLIASSRSSAGGLVAVGDNHGRVRLARFPCTERDTNFLTCRGHGSVVSNVRFAFDDSALFTCGAQDGCIIQWSMHHVGVDNSAVSKLEVRLFACVLSFLRAVASCLVVRLRSHVRYVCPTAEGVGNRSARPAYGSTAGEAATGQRCAERHNDGDFRDGGGRHNSQRDATLAANHCGAQLRRSAERQRTNQPFAAGASVWFQSDRSQGRRRVHGKQGRCHGGRHHGRCDEHEGAGAEVLHGT